MRKATTKAQINTGAQNEWRGVNFLIKKLLSSVLGRWVTGSLIALLLGGSALKWHSFKENLIHKGQQVCVQEINKQTVTDLENALAAERVTATKLRALATAAAAENEASRTRLREAETKVAGLLAERKEQERTDETYAAWSNTPLPAGVADRMRSLRSGSN